MSERLLHATYRAEQRHFWFRGFRGFVRTFLEEATRGMAEPRMLDCGCGTGANLNLLAGFGRPFGIDITEVGLRYAFEYGQPRVARASITTLPFADGRFDVVTAFDVLYSLGRKDEVRALAEMYRVLRPGGTLVVNVAALPILRGNHAIFGGELRRSTRRRLRALLGRAGFTVVRLTYTNASLFPLMLAVRMFQRTVGLATPEESGTEIVVPASPINAVLSGAVALEARLLRLMDMPIGSSLLCLARRES